MDVHKKCPLSFVTSCLITDAIGCPDALTRGFDSLHPLQYPRAFREFCQFLCHFCAKAYVSKWNASGASSLRSHIHHSQQWISRDLREYLSASFGSQCIFKMMNLSPQSIPIAPTDVVGVDGQTLNSLPKLRIEFGALAQEQRRHLV